MKDVLVSSVIVVPFNERKKRKEKTLTPASMTIVSVGRVYTTVIGERHSATLVDVSCLINNPFSS